MGQTLHDCQLGLTGQDKNDHAVRQKREFNLRAIKIKPPICLRDGRQRMSRQSGRRFADRTCANQ
jgi:hypothetical protein